MERYFSSRALEPFCSVESNRSKTINAIVVKGIWTSGSGGDVI